MSKNMELATRLKEARKYLNLSQEYVGGLLGLKHSAISEIENGKRDVSATELKFLCEIFGVSVEELLYGKKSEIGVIFARAFTDLTDEDKNEIMNLIQLKRKLNEKNSASI